MQAGDSEIPIGDIKRGAKNVSTDTLMRIATTLKISLSDLVRNS